MSKVYFENGVQHPLNILFSCTLLCCRGFKAKLHFSGFLVTIFLNLI